MRESRNTAQRVTITVTRSGEEPIAVMRYFHPYERLSLELLLDAGSIDVTKHVLEVGDEFAIAVDRVVPRSG